MWRWFRFVSSWRGLLLAHDGKDDNQTDGPYRYEDGFREAGSPGKNPLPQNGRLCNDGSNGHRERSRLLVMFLGKEGGS